MGEVCNKYIYIALISGQVKTIPNHAYAVLLINAVVNRLNEEAGYKSAIAGSIIRDFAWHLKWSRVEKKLLSLSHYKPLPIHIFIGLTVQKSKKKYP